MKLLALDTATEACSAALYLDGEITATFEVCPQQHSQKILPMIDGLLRDADCPLASLDALVFGRGPGSFTGVRIAMGVLQGLALGAELKVVGVSTLAAMAQQTYEQQGAERVYAAIDARMSEVYFAEYQHQGDTMVLCTEELVLAPDVAAKRISGSEFALAGSGWQAYEALQPWLTDNQPPQVLLPAAQYMFKLAIAAIERGEAVDVEDAQPVYLRDKVTWKKLPGR